MTNEEPHQQLLKIFLTALQAAFGPRDETWRIGPIRFATEPAEPPHVRFAADGVREVWITLAVSAGRCVQRATFQIAHESVHLLAPALAEHVLVVEEGLATHVSHDICESLGLAMWMDCPRYLAAEQLVVRLTRDAGPGVIRRLREERPSFSTWSPGFLLTHVPDLEPEHAELLCRPFDGFGADGALRVLSTLTAPHARSIGPRP